MVLRLCSIPLGESPPPPPRACFGRDELIERIIGHAENLAPIALIGAGGIGKTSVALAVLHHDRIKERFGDNRRFIRCDQFPASRANFLGRLSKVIGAGVENPEDMTPLRPHLSSKEMVITLDNAESILDPRGVNAGDIFAVVEELSQFSNICLCITSRITTIPADCRCLDVPTLAMDAARSAFYHIYGNDERPDLINDILKQLDFHPLSVALLATVGHHNGWGADRLAMEWGQRQTDVLRTEHSKSLAATIELSLASPMFLELGSDARDLLGVVAFFPQGVCENNLDWLFSRRNTFSRLFPTISDRLFPANSERKNVFDKFCVLSLTYRSNGFITMLAPLRDYFYPKSPESSSLLRTTKKCYFHRLSASTNLDSNPNFGETQWITSEDVNVEHLLDIFTSIDANSDKVWKACADFMRHLYWHKPRLTVLGPKMEGLPNDHRSKLECLLELSRLFERVGNFMECKRLLTLILQLWRERGDDYWVAPALRRLSNANRLMGLHEEGIQQAKEALEIFERLGDTVEQAECLNCLALLLLEDEQLDAAGEAVSRSINLLDKGERFSVCGSHHLLGNIYRSKGEREKAIFHFEVALGIASSFNWHDHLFWIHDSLAQLFLDEDRFDDAHTHVEQAKSHVVNDTYFLGRAMGLQAMVWYKQGRLAEARSEASHAADVYEKLGAVQDLEDCRGFLRQIEGKMNNPVASG